MRLLQPVPADRHTARFALLLPGLVAYGVSVALLAQAGWGVMPWLVLDQGLHRTFGLQLGTWTIITSLLVLMLWVPLRQRPGVGTLCNAVVIGLVIDATVALVPAAHTWPAQLPMMVGGILLNAVATGAYIGAGLGPGTRDGLTTGLAARGLSLRLVRTSIEVVVLAVGWLLGGTVGIGTVLYAVLIGPLTHRTIPALQLRTRPPATVSPVSAGPAAEAAPAALPPAA
jgi:uncharacterized membrane protein YczE